MQFYLSITIVRAVFCFIAALFTYHIAPLFIAGNPWPPVNEHAVDTSKWIHNVLLTAARKSMTNKTTDTSLSDIALNTGQTHGTAV